MRTEPILAVVMPPVTDLPHDAALDLWTTITSSVTALLAEGEWVPTVHARHASRAAVVERDGVTYRFHTSDRALVDAVRAQRPDVVHIATEGPLGWSALNAAVQLRLPVTTDFRTNFHTYTSHYGIGWLRGAILAYMKKFHNAAHATMVPTAALEGELADSGFKRLSVVPRGIDTGLFSPAQRRPQLRSSCTISQAESRHEPLALVRVSSGVCTPGSMRMV